MTRLMAAAATISMLAISTSAFAAESSGVSISTVSGGVLVNQGHGFKPATPGMNLRAGDRVLVTSTGQAALRYSGGCGVSLGSGSMATISASTPCQSGAHNAGIVGTQSLQSANGVLAKPAVGHLLPPPIGVLRGLGGGGQSSSP